MREFHKVMFEHKARLKYTDSGIEVYLENPCSLKAVKDLAEAFYIEFGVRSDTIKLESAGKYVCLDVPVSIEAGKAEPEESKIEDEAAKDGQISEYHERVLNTALDVLSEGGGLSPGELQRELAKRGVVATGHLIGLLLSNSGKAERRGNKWYLKDDESSEDNEDSKWIQLTDRIGYKIDDQWIMIGQKRDDGKIETLKHIPYDILKDLYRALPDEANSADINAVATAMDLNPANLETILMRILAREFGGELQT